MRTVHYSEILNGSAGLAGILPADIGTAEFALFRTFHDRRLQAAWEIEDWPDLCPIEQRTFRPSWNSGVTYAATAEVYDPLSQTYYQSLVGGNLNNPPTSYVNALYQVDNLHWALSNPKYSGSAFVSGNTYAQATIVLSPLDQNYYQLIPTSLTAVTDPSLDPTNWGKLTPFNRYVAWQQFDGTSPLPGNPLTPIGEFLKAWDKDPRVTTKTVPLDNYFLSVDGAQFPTLKHQFSFVWIKYRKQRPGLTGDAFDATVAYGTGRQVYYTLADTTSADFYTATTTTTAGDTPESAPSKWSIVPLPYFLRGYLIEAGFADWLTADGQDTKAAEHEAMATQNPTGTGYLEMEVDKFRRQQGQTRRLIWKG